MRGKILKVAIGACFSVLLAWFAAKIFIYASTAPPLPPQFHLSTNSRATAKNGPVKARVEREIIMARNLFHAAPERLNGSHDGKGEPVSEEEESRLLAEMDKLPVSKQGWTLLGTIVNTLTPAQSRAVLLMEGKQAALGTGEKIKGWEIIFIERRTIILAKNGRRERLLLGGGETGPAPVTQARRSLQAREIERALSDLPGLMRQASFSPVNKAGVQGLSLTLKNSDGILSRLGLRSNDIITQANGRSLGSLADLAAFANLANQSALHLELLRDGQNMVLEFDINR